MPNYIKFLFSFLEQVVRIELTSLVWKTRVITTIRYLLKDPISVFSSYSGHDRLPTVCSQDRTRTCNLDDISILR